MRIKIEKTAEIAAALGAANGKAIAHVISDPSRIIEIADRAEQKLADAGLAKNKRAGATVIYIPGGATIIYIPGGPGKSYDYKAMTTRVWLERNTTGWLLVDAQREEIYPTSVEHLDISITQHMRDEIVKKSLAPFCVIEGE